MISQMMVMIGSNKVKGMKRILSYISLAFALLVFFSCVEEFENGFDEVKVEKIFYVTAPDDSLKTKTIVNQNLEDGKYQLHWLPDDCIGISSGNSTVEKFENISPESGKSAVFKGNIANSDTYYAVYPYYEGMTLSSSRITVTIPSEQPYIENSFASNVCPMAGRSGEDSKIYFNNLCGVLVINLTGTEKISSISFVGYDELGIAIKVSGEYTVDLKNEEIPVLKTTSKSNAKVSVVCDQPIQLNEAEPTAFYFVLPPAVYNSFRLVVTTSDGSIMYKEAKKPLTIRRANITVAGALEYVEAVDVNLSERGNANCYIVNEEGVYSFDAATIGNGEYGLISGIDFHTDNVSISPASVEVLWSEPESLLTALSFDIINKRVKFVSSGNEGNAIIAVKDSDGTILWSWHIWATDQPKEHIYENSAGKFKVLDRNLGAIRCDQGIDEEYKDSYGLLYQWGRKDPFELNNITYLTWNGNSNYSLEYIIQHPAALSVCDGGYSSVSDWNNTQIRGLWTASTKTIYDPCPVGYRVPPSTIWVGFEDVEKLDTSYESGLWVRYNETDYAWYPFTPYHEYRKSSINYNNGNIRVWTSTQEIVNTAGRNMENSLNYTKGSADTGFELHRNNNDVLALSVRCMRDERYVDISLPRIFDLYISDVISDSAEISYQVLNNDDNELIETGVLVSDEIDKDQQDWLKVSVVPLEYKYEAMLSDLQPNTWYYVMAYATNNYGTTFSDIHSFNTFKTPNTDWNNLCLNGTSNCYIVKPDGNKNAFNCTVKGNSNKKVGDVYSVEVLWETNTNYGLADTGTIIHDVEIIGEYVVFTPLNAGNALIAVKDIEGEILWSWHIWVCDYDPGTTAQTYISGAVMMDRNLGAISDSGRSAYGLYYQWGRKDPFLGLDGSSILPNIKEYVEGSSSITVEYTIQNPTKVILEESDWNNDFSLWQRNKTIYDPCPPGWRVPNGGFDGAWVGFQSAEEGQFFAYYEPYSIPTAYYPKAGMIINSEPWHIGSTISCWSCDIGSVFVDSWYVSNYMNNYNIQYECSVRCMKE